MRNVGPESDIKPTLEEINILWITIEEIEDTSGKSPLINRSKGSKPVHVKRIPSLWFSYKNELYYCVFNTEFSLFETYDDWDDFDDHNPGLKELKILFSYVHTFYKVDSKFILSNDLGEFCQHEIDFIKEYQ